MIDDIGSGVLSRVPGPLGELTADEPAAAESVAAGADVVCFSGDKLLGGPQAGIAVGAAAAIERMRAHPLARAVRIDKLSLAALEATLRLHRDPGRRPRRSRSWRCSPPASTTCSSAQCGSTTGSRRTRRRAARCGS